jgi:transposase
MDLLLGFPGLTVRDVTETFEEVAVLADADGDAPTCPSCASTRLMAPHGTVETKLWDAPMRGKRCRLIVRRRRFICSCGKTMALDMPAIGEYEFPSITIRLARYIEDQSFRRPMKGIADEVGASATIVSRLVNRLASHLHRVHQFPTPTVLGIDDLRIRKKLYTVVTDATSGYPVALVEGGKELPIRREMHRRGIDEHAVKVVVSDMGGSNIAVFENLFKNTPAIHVADKFHVLKGVNEALRLVINKRVDRLRRRRALWEKRLVKIGLTHAPKKGPAVLKSWSKRIDTLLSARDALLGARVRVGAAQRPLFDVRTEIIEPICKRYPEIGKAFFTKLRLHLVYARPDRAAADREIDRFLLRAAAKSIAPQMKVIVERVKKHRAIILNYYDALAALGGDYERVPTTGPTEQRNGTIKRAWSMARGYNSHEAFCLRALYEPWRIGSDIAICWGGRTETADAAGKLVVTYCADVSGPFPGQEDTRRQAVMPPLYRHRCAIHPT